MRNWKQASSILIFAMIYSSLAAAVDTTKNGQFLNLTNSHIREVQLTLDPKHLPQPAVCLLIEKSQDGINFELVKRIPVGKDAAPIVIADHLINDQRVLYRVSARLDALHSEVVEVTCLDPQQQFEISHETDDMGQTSRLPDPHLVQ